MIKNDDPHMTLKTRVTEGYSKYPNEFVAWMAEHELGVRGPDIALSDKG